MKFKNNVVDFPSPLSQKKKKYIIIRDEVERILAQYAQDQGDLWAVALASGRFSSMTLGNIEGSDKDRITPMKTLLLQIGINLTTYCLNSFNNPFIS